MLLLVIHQNTKFFTTIGNPAQNKANEQDEQAAPSLGVCSLSLELVRSYMELSAQFGSPSTRQILKYWHKSN